MTKEDKQLLLKDLCGRLPHGVIVQYKGHNTIIKNKLLTGSDLDCNMEYYKPFLRPMSSMVVEEFKEFKDTWEYLKHRPDVCVLSVASYDWLNKKMLDYRGLIEKGLAIEAPEGMYGKEKQQ